MWEKFGHMSTEEIYEKLKQVDPVSAHRIHPNERRKLCRYKVSHFL